jgi:hypothetical protein
VSGTWVYSLAYDFDRQLLYAGTDAGVFPIRRLHLAEHRGERCRAIP